MHRRRPARPTRRGWHEADARDAEAIGDGFGARWHLDRLIAARPDDGLLHARRARAWLWAGRLAAAEADLDRALALGPRDRILDWLEHRAADSLADGRPADALRLLDRVIAARPGDWLSLRAPRRGPRRRSAAPADREADLDARDRAGCRHPVPDPHRRRAEPGRPMGRGRAPLRPGHRDGDGPVRGLDAGRDRPPGDRRRGGLPPGLRGDARPAPGGDLRGDRSRLPGRPS